MVADPINPLCPGINRTLPICAGCPKSNVSTATWPGASPSAVCQTVERSPSIAFVPGTVDPEREVCATG